MCKKLFGGGGRTTTIVQEVKAPPPPAVAAPVRSNISTGANVKGVDQEGNSANTTQASGLSGDTGRYSTSAAGRETTGRVKLGVESKRTAGVGVGLTI